MGFPLKTGYKPGQPLHRFSFGDWNTICNVFNTIEIVLTSPGSKAEIIRNSDGRGWKLVIPRSGGVATGLDLSKASFGFVINGTSVTINDGEIDRIAVTGTTITPADGNYVYVRRTISNDTMEMIAGTSVPPEDTTYKYYRLYRFAVVGGMVSIMNMFRPFDIDVGLGLPSNANTLKGTLIVTDDDNNTSVDDPGLWTTGSMEDGILVSVGGTYRTIMLRELDVCINGVAKKMLVFASEPY